MLGLAMRAGQIVTGEPKTRDLIASGKAVLVLHDTDVSANTEKTVRDKCRFYGVPLYRTAAGRMGQAVGKPASMCLGVCSGGLGNQLLKKVMENEFEDVFKDFE